MTVATFDANDHALTPGWATYHHKLGWRRFLCLFLGHSRAADPEGPTGWSPREVRRCTRCGSGMKWFVVGQHRYGGLDR